MRTKHKSSIKYYLLFIVSLLLFIQYFYSISFPYSSSKVIIYIFYRSLITFIKMTKNYSLWLNTPEPLYTSLYNVIKDTASKYGGPSFEPHVTLLGSIPAQSDEEISSRIQNLAKVVHVQFNCLLLTVILIIL